MSGPHRLGHGEDLGGGGGGAGVGRVGHVPSNVGDGLSLFAGQAVQVDGDLRPGVNGEDGEEEEEEEGEPHLGLHGET